MPSNRMHRGLVALSASAIAAVYMAGYLRTQSADASIGAAAAALSPGVPASAAIATNPPVGATPTAIPPVVQRQSAQVDIVSRATYSSQAFRQAVSQAL